MFTLNVLQPQCVLPLSQLGSVVTSVRSALLSRGSIKTAASGNEDECLALQVENRANMCLQELGVKEWGPDIRVKVVPPVLLPALSSKSPWKESHVSAPTFFQNRYGFSEKELWMSTFANQPLTVTVMLPSASPRGLHMRGFPQQFLQQTRGFKTKRSKTVMGIGKSEEETSTFKYLRKSVLDRLSGNAKSKQDDRIKTILQDSNHSPEVQDKLKVAFAEGYTANEKKEVPEPLFKRLARFFIYACLLAYVVQMLTIYSVMGGNININPLKGERYEVNPEDITITFEDVKGVDEAKEELKDVVEFLRDPERFKSVGAKLPKGVLLVGPPGIGKTLLARAVAGEANVPFFHASGSEFDEMFVGTGAKRVRQLFDAAKARTPCVVFIDEIDTVGAKRTSSQVHPYANQTINQLLSEMDGFQKNEGVIVLGATNKRDHLDKALLRPGRFDVEVRVFPPDLKGRRDILDLYLSKVKVAPDVEIDALAKGTTGCTGADLENIVNQAALKAGKDGDPAVNTSHLDFAKDKVFMGPAKKSRIKDEETNLMTAYHEAGHTLVAYFTKDATPLHKVTIIPRGMSLGHTSFVPEKEQYSVSRSQLMAQMDVAMGGRVAEELIYGQEKVTTGAGTDLSAATAVASAMVKQYGMSDKVGFRVFDEDSDEIGLFMRRGNKVSSAFTELVDLEIKRLLQESYDRAKTILRTHSAEHKSLAKALMKYETLDAEEIKNIIEGKKLDNKL